MVYAPIRRKVEAFKLRKEARIQVLMAHGLSYDDALCIALFLERITAEYYRRLADRGPETR